MPNVTVRRDILETDGHLLRNTGLLHGDAVDGVGTRHSSLRVGDNDELCGTHKLFEYLDETDDVGFVECRIDFVEHTERARPTAENGEQQCHASKRALAA